MVRLRRAVAVAALLVPLLSCGSGGSGDGDNAGTDEAGGATATATEAASPAPAESEPSEELEESEQPAGTEQPDDAAGAAGDWWRPAAGTDWQWQLTGEIDTSVDAPVYDIDGFETDASVVDGLHADGRKVICYINVGAFEDWRPDAADFPDEVIGNDLAEWEGERWLDVRRLDVLEPIMAARFDMCAEKGFDAVEPDNMDGYDNDPGFPLTRADQIAYNRMIADLAHERGLAVGLKNGLDQIDELVDDFDFSVNEECAHYEECELLTPFIEAGKPVFHVEYEMTTDEFCPITQPLGFSSLAKNWDLDPWRETCPAP
ncbi:endo alpha-1,4 polygalactosaminidase [Streptomyces sp. RFCAC02]|uniref:endo alpha-1,4 polygalactosaminidase n=1 Tax=Streptomyces sp. RFCAC02 TaxID=2499143 RepID=UPI0010227329|nr:endo alpha-1,4 polygalactosaminidase [Streptomyces sp. RFCAC02]